MNNEYVCAGPANTFGEKNLVKSLQISTLDKVINCKGSFLQDPTKPLLTAQKRLETS
jgi:hypothetical protein